MPLVKPFTRWSADTEIAFLLALRLTGRVRLAAAEVGRSVGTAYKRRQRHPDFAARWDAVVDEVQARWAEAHAGDGTGPAAVPAGASAGAAAGAAGAGAWSPVRERAFLRALSETGDVAVACERVGVGERAARGLRSAYPGFAQAWDAALDRAAPMLEQIAWERAVEGWEEPIVVRGAIVGHRRRYSEPLLKLLLAREAAAAARTAGARPAGPHELKLRAREAARAAGGDFVDIATAEETDRLLRRKLDALAKRLRAEEAREADGGAQAGDTGSTGRLRRDGLPAWARAFAGEADERTE